MKIAVVATEPIDNKTFDVWLARFMIDPSEYEVLTLVDYNPEDENGKHKALTAKEKDENRPDLLAKLKAIDPKLIVAVGGPMLKELIDYQDMLPPREVPEGVKVTYLNYCAVPLPLRSYYSELKCQVIGMPLPSYFSFEPMFKDSDNDAYRNRFTRAAFQAIHEAFNRPRELVFDIETDGLDVNTAKVVYFGYYSYPEQKFGVVTTPFEIQEILDKHSHLIGFNNKEFDQKILTNNGSKLYGKVTIDMLRGLKARGRREDMGLHDLRDNKLDTVVRFLKLGEKKEIDFSILKKPMRSAEEDKMCREYLARDIEVTKKLFEWWTDWCAPFAQYVNKEHQWRQNYKTCSSASYAYKVICHATGREELFKEDGEIPEGEEEDDFEGGFCSADKEEARGNLLLFDFASLYPHNFFQANLFSPVTKLYTGPTFKANEFYPDLKGVYKADKLGEVETVLKHFYLERVKFKKANDPRQYALKILLNSSYGAASSQKFLSIHNPTIGPDTTYIGRQNIKYVRAKLLEAGFILCMTDTDSVVLEIPEGRTEAEAVKVINGCVMEIKRWLPFPADTFKMVLEKHIKYWQMFKHRKTGALLKKFYLFVTTDNEITTKGLPVVKSNSTGLGKKIYEILKPRILESLQCKFSEQYFDDLMRVLAKEDISLAAKKFKVKETSEYKLPSQLDCQISQRYGAGNHWLIRNKIVGAGLKVKYGLVAEVKDIGLEFIDFTLTKDELCYFVKSGLGAYQ